MIMRLEEFTGQKSVITILKHWQYSNVNLLLRGSHGHGKTSMMKSFAAYRVAPNGIPDWYYFEVPPPDSIVTRISKDRATVVVDEIHLERKPERWYPIMDRKDRAMLFGTTRTAALAHPFTSRCMTLTLEDYSTIEISLMLIRWYERQYKGNIHPSLARVIADRSCGNPRIAINLLYGAVEAYGKDIRLSQLLDYLDLLGITDNGLDRRCLKYLDALSFEVPVSLNNIAAMLQLDTGTIRNEIEPVLLRMGYIKITSRGRLKC